MASAHFRRSLILVAMLGMIFSAFMLITSLGHVPGDLTEQEKPALTRLGAAWSVLDELPTFPASGLVVTGLRREGFRAAQGSCKKALAWKGAPVEIWVDPRSRIDEIILYSRVGDYNLRLKGLASSRAIVAKDTCKPLTGGEARTSARGAVR